MLIKKTHIFICFCLQRCYHHVFYSKSSTWLKVWFAPHSDGPSKTISSNDNTCSNMSNTDNSRDDLCCECCGTYSGRRRPGRNLFIDGEWVPVGRLKEKVGSQGGIPVKERIWGHESVLKREALTFCGINGASPWNGGQGRPWGDCKEGRHAGTYGASLKLLPKPPGTIRPTPCLPANSAERFLELFSTILELSQNPFFSFNYFSTLFQL